MPTIKPFKAIHPQSVNAAKVVSTIEEMSLDAAKQIRNKNPQSFIHLLVPEVDSTLQGEARKQLIFKAINKNLENFMRAGILVRDSVPAIYIYRLITNNGSYTGLWATTSIDDYANGKIKQHEHIKPEKEEQLSLYLEKTGIDANPVLLTYRSSALINDLITTTLSSVPQIEFTKDSEQHILWRVDKAADVGAFVHAFSALGSAYIADGHHRASAVCKHGLKRRKELQKWDGTEDFNYFSSVYIPDNQLQLASFNRLVKGLGGFSTHGFLEALQKDFNLSNLRQKPTDLANSQIGLYTDGSWYKLEPRPHVSGRSSLVDSWAVSVLEKFILKPLLKITVPDLDNRLHFVSGLHPIHMLEEKVNSAEFDVAFLLHPVEIGTFMDIADAGEIMPPKSTWFEPKFPVGLLVHQIS